jgi:ABC-type antimicrobial peptide transport system permease subunit
MFAFGISPMYNSYMKEKHPDILEVTVDGGHFNYAELLEYYGLTDIRVEINGNLYYNMVVKKSGKMEAADSTIDVVESFQAFLIWLGDECEEEVIEGRVWDISDNEEDKRYVWLGANVSKEYDCTIGDRILVNDDGTDMGDYEVVGIFSEDSMYSDALVFSFMPFYYVAEENGIFIEHVVYGTLEDMSEYAYVNEQLSYLYMSLSSPLEDIFRMIAYVKAILILLSLLIVLVGMSSTYNLFNMYVSGRKRYLFIQKMLGCRTGTILKIYFVIFEVVIVLSSILAVFLTFGVSIYMNGVIGSLFEGCSLNASQLPIFTILIFLACNGFMALSMLRLRNEVGVGNLMEMVEVVE